MAKKTSAAIKSSNPEQTPPTYADKRIHQAELDRLRDGIGEDAPHTHATEAAQVPTKPSSAGEKVVVANKLPMALRIRTFRKVSVIEQRPNAPSKEVQMAEAHEDTYVIQGIAQLNGTGRTKLRDNRRILHGYAFTEGVPKDVYDQWAADNADANFIKNNLVFCASDMQRAEAIARENEKRVTNMEPWNPDGDHRGIKSVVTGTRD